MTINKKLKRFSVVTIIILTAIIAYVEIKNIHSQNMTYRQKFLKAFYPAWMWLGKVTGKRTESLTDNKQPMVSFYSLKDTLIDGRPFDFTQLKGKKILLVNTASDCGYTDQYSDLEKLAESYKDKLLVLGFPANDFKEQEKGSNEEIAAFCKRNYGVSFPLMQKSSVIKTGDQNPVFKWLSDPAQNGWNGKQPSWNFSKYLVSEDGRLLNYFDPGVSPQSAEVINAINSR
ncbi:MAG: glutathione peroxidase [Ferruginibacter sp.]